MEQNTAKTPRPFNPKMLQSLEFRGAKCEARQIFSLTHKQARWREEKLKVVSVHHPACYGQQHSAPARTSVRRIENDSEPWGKKRTMTTATQANDLPSLREPANCRLNRISDNQNFVYFVHLSIVRVGDVVARLTPEPKGAVASACFPHARPVVRTLCVLCLAKANIGEDIKNNELPYVLSTSKRNEKHKTASDCWEVWFVSGSPANSRLTSPEQSGAQHNRSFSTRLHTVLLDTDIGTRQGGVAAYAIFLGTAVLTFSSALHL